MNYIYWIHFLLTTFDFFNKAMLLPFQYKTPNYTYRTYIPTFKITQEDLHHCKCTQQNSTKTTICIKSIQQNQLQGINQMVSVKLFLSCIR